MAYAFSATIFILGLVVTLISEHLPTINQFDLSKIGSAAGSFIVASAIFSAFFEWRGKKEIAQYVMREVGASFEVRQAGIDGFIPDSGSGNLSNEIKVAKKITAVFTYSSRFLKRYEDDISHCLRNGGDVTVVVQSKDSPTIHGMRSLGWEDEDINSNFSTNKAIFDRLKSQGKIRLLYHSGIRAYSTTIIDNSAHISFATNANGRSRVPRLRAQRGGQMFEFVEKDCQLVVSQSSDPNKT